MSPRARPMPPQQRRAAIISAATPLLLEHGLSVSTRDIAVAAGIAEGTLFRAFDSKDDLIDAVVRSVFDPAPTCADLDAIDRALPLTERLTRAAETLQRRVHSVARLIAVLRLYQSERFAHGDEAPQQVHRRRVEQITQSLIAVIGADAQNLRTTPRRAASLLWTMSASSAHLSMTQGEQIPAIEFTDLLLHGLIDPSHHLASATQHHDVLRTDSSPRTEHSPHLNQEVTC